MNTFITYIALQAVVFQTVLGQCVNRVVPGCGQNMVMEALLPNQLILREPVVPVAPTTPCHPVGPVAPFLPIAPGPILPPIEPIGYAPTIIHDSSVANSLANALQLLVVSNLLSSTLPGPCDYPAYPIDYLSPLAPLAPIPGYSYIY